MRIANPIYDVAFKYLMEDVDIARQLIGQIISKEIITLDLRPQEIAGKSQQEGVSILRVDFKAIIQEASGEQKKVLIELQKSWHPDDILRFRRYLAENYAKPDKNPQGQPIEPLPIITIYFLGFKLAQVATPVVHVNRQYRNLVNGEVLNVRDPFIERLTHDSYVIQIRRLEEPYQTELERVLRIFDQTFISRDDNRIMVLTDEVLESDSLLQKMARRLMEAAADEALLKQMFIEDWIDNRISDLVRDREGLSEQNQKLNEANQDLTSTNQELANTNQTLQNQLSAQERLIEELRRKLSED